MKRHYSFGLLIAILTILAGTLFAYGQGFGRFGRFFRVTQNEPPSTELVVARWSYHAIGKFGGTGWSHNYPTSDQHIAQVISEATNIDVTRMSYRIVELGSPEVLTIHSLLFPNQAKWR